MASEATEAACSESDFSMMLSSADTRLAISFSACCQSLALHAHMRTVAYLATTVASLASTTHAGAALPKRSNTKRTKRIKTRARLTKVTKNGANYRSFEAKFFGARPQALGHAVLRPLVFARVIRVNRLKLEIQLRVAPGVAKVDLIRGATRSRRHVHVWPVLALRRATHARSWRREGSSLLLGDAIPCCGCLGIRGRRRRLNVQNFRGGTGKGSVGGCNP